MSNSRQPGKLNKDLKLEKRNQEWTNLAEHSKECYGSKSAVLLIIKPYTNNVY
jgi:hypothetical protein